MKYYKAGKMETAVVLFVMCVLVLSEVRGEIVSKQTLRIPENMPLCSVIGNIFKMADELDNLRHESGLSCSILKHGNPYGNYFNITKSSGDIYLLRKLDREEICHNQIECTIKLGVALTFGLSQVKILRVDITVTDVNDNTPSFPEESLLIEVPQDAEVNSNFPIAPAMDLDRGENSLLTYTAINSTMFSLNVARNLDGSDDIQLVLKRKLEEELQQSYKITILATDGGSPPRTGSVDVLVLIKSVNTPPVFIPTDGTVNVVENVPVVLPLIMVTAIDGDTGENGEVSYRISAETMMKYPDQFSINAVSGEIFASKPFDFEEKKFYVLIIEAVDKGSPALTSSTEVKVKVADVNDNTPEISVFFFTDSDEANLSEFSQIQHFVAAISVNDKDSGVNGKATCSTDSEFFGLIVISKTDFHLVQTDLLDREEAPKHRVLITCKDGGSPPNVVSKDIIVNVLDENDNSPKFLETNSKKILPATLRVGEEVLQMTAVDNDTDDNAEISYIISPPNEYFSIGPISGVIQVTKTLTALPEQEIILTVIATDNGIPPRQTKTSVFITVKPEQGLSHRLSSPENTIIFSSNVVIVIAVLTLTTIASVALIIAIWRIRGNNSDIDDPERNGTLNESAISVISTEKLKINIDI